MCGALRKSTEMSFLNFSELVPNGHVTVSHDNMMYAVDLVMLVNNKDRIQANNTLHNLKGSLFSSQKILTKKMPGKGNARCKLISFAQSLSARLSSYLTAY